MRRSPECPGPSAGSRNHGPGAREEPERGWRGRPRAGGAPRAGGWREAGPKAEGNPNITADPAGTLVGGTPVGMDADAVVARAEIARWLVRADFPSDGPNLVEAARDHRAPDAVVAELERLPEGETFERVGDVVRALGYPTET